MKNTLFIIVLFITTFWTANLQAQENYALKLATPSQGVLFKHTNNISPTKIWTVELWVKRTATSNFSTLIDGETSKLTLETWRSGNDWKYRVGFSKKGSGDKEFNYVAPLNQWVHLAFVADGTGVSLYVNGETKGKINTAIDLPLKGFGLLGNPNESPKALIDEVRMWNRALSISEIKSNMNQSVATTADGLIAYWYFDDKNTTSPIDLSTSGITSENKGATYVKNDNENFTTKHSKMEIENTIATHENEYLLKSGAKNQEILCVKVQTKGVYTPLKLSKINVTLEGTTKLSDIDKVAVSYTGKSHQFATTNLIGGKINPATGLLSFEKEIILQPGTNHFWVAVDINNTTKEGNVFDATCPSVVIDGKKIATQVSNPTGNRIIATEVFTPSSASLDIIPKPTKMVLGKGTFQLNKQTKILYNDQQAKEEAQFLRNFLIIPTGYELPISQATEGTNSIILKLVETTEPINQEGYKVTVNEDNVTIEAQSRMGLFWGIQTLRQLFSVDIESQTAIDKTQWAIPEVSIEDQPRFGFRGMHLDVARHFFPPSFVKRYIDILAMYKMNKFHWHLTEDQGWRIEIKKYPKLQSVSAWRTCDGTKYGGYYTQDEVKDIVAYATKRHITIIPEIETPGHSIAALSAYPELGCVSGPGKYDVRCQWGQTIDLYCAGKETTFEFLENVLTEVIDLFPSEYIHIGGDEAKKDRWKTCPDCQKRKKDLNLQNEEQLQKYFVERIATFLSTKGRKVIGWSEITHGGVPENAIVQDWAPARPVAKEAVQAGRQVIMSDNQYVYFDYRQTASSSEQGAYWAWLGLDKVYGYEPIPNNFTSNERKLVLGVEGCAWTEYMPTERDVEYMILPRLLALSEVAWTPQNMKNYNNFKNRLQSHYSRFDLLGYASRKLSTPQSVSRTISSCEPVTLNAETKGVSYYWNNPTHATTPSIVVDKSGTYKCYINVMGKMVENTFDVTIEQTAGKPTVNINKKTDEKELHVTGEYANYYWYKNATENATPFAVGKSINLPLDEQTDNYYVSGVLFKNTTESLQLDGENDLLEIEKSDFLNNTSTFTFEAWIKINRWRAWDVVMNKKATNDRRIAIEIGRNEGEIYAQVAQNGNAYALATNAVKTGEWFHLGVIYDGTKSGNDQRLKMYINGNQQELSFGGAAIPAKTSSITQPLQLGLQGQEPAMNYADIRYWSTARTAKQIKDNIYQLKDTDKSLQLHYPMDNVNGNVIYDLANNTKSTLKNTADAKSHSVPNGLMTYGCETEKWMVGEITGIHIAKSNTLGTSIYPNPTDGVITIKFPFQTAQNIKIKAYDTQGRQLFSDNLSLNGVSTHQYDLSHIGKGVFFLTIIHNQQQDNMKIVMK